MVNSQTAQATSQILAISGSLRAASSNTSILRAAVMLAPSDTEVVLYNGLGDLPHFNPDLDGENAPKAVEEFRSRLRAADGVLICSPEYAHGVPGVLKNALDWIVGSGELMGKPVALINASRATYAQASLAETLSVMMAKLIVESPIAMPLPTNRIDEAQIIAEPSLAGALRTAINALLRDIEVAAVEAKNL